MDENKTETEAIAIIDKRAAAMPVEKAHEEPTGAALIRVAIERGTSLDQLEKLMALQERWEANEARKAFVVAMAACKADLPATVSKDHQVDFPMKDDGGGKGRVQYRHTTLANLVGEVLPVLARHGLSHGYETHQDENGRITVSCRLQHVMGHSEIVTLAAYPDESGRKNKIQAIGSTVTYLQRYTLMAALGIASSDDDDAGAGARTKAAQSEPEDRAVSPRATKAASSFETTYGVPQKAIEKLLGKPITDWEPEDLQVLGKHWDRIAKLPAEERRSAMRKTFNLTEE